MAGEPEVARLGEHDWAALGALLARFGLQLCRVGAGEEIPGSYWGEPEAGLIGDQVYARADTPLHSLCHEAAHAIVMGAERRIRLVRDAGGDDAEENAVCYLQVLLGGALAGYGRAAMWRDMDAWGYTFRLGSAQRWFEEDAAEAAARLCGLGLALPEAGGVGLVLPAAGAVPRPPALR